MWAKARKRVPGTATSHLRRTEGTQRAQRIVHVRKEWVQMGDTEERGNGRDRDRDAVRTRIGRDRDRPERNSGAGEAKVLTAMGTAGAREMSRQSQGQGATWRLEASNMLAR